MRVLRHRSLLSGLVAGLAVASTAHAAPPEVGALAWCPSSKSCLQWSSASQATEYKVYRGVHAGLPNLLTGAPDSCVELVSSGTGTGPLLTATPAPGALFWFLVTAANICGEGSAGSASGGGPHIVNATGSCTASCMDNVRNGTETDRDCGGPICQPCVVGKICASVADCQTRHCLASHCQPATCTDGLRNDVETDVDCGGGTCVGCTNGKSCCVADDCQSGHCGGGLCQP